MQKGETIKAVSAELGVDIRRVAAVVRLKEVEKDWIAKVSRLLHFFYYSNPSGALYDDYQHYPIR